MAYTNKTKTITQSSICFVAGKSGGHILPALTLAEQYKNEKTTRIIFFTTGNILDKTIVQKHASIEHIPLPFDAMPNSIIGFFRHIVQMLHASWIIITTFYTTRPKKIISMGGYVSFPVSIIGYMFGIPIELYELNAIPGKAIKTISPLAHTIFACFATAQKQLPAHKTYPFDYPLKFTQQDKITQANALEQLQWSKQRKTILILGGSQGSLFINQLIKEWLSIVPQQSHDMIQCIHQTGTIESGNLQQLYQTLNIPSLVFPYHDSMALYYNAADIIVCRAGAGTLFETIFFNKKSIVIPLETKTTDHQLSNAREIALQYPELITIIQQQSLEITMHNFMHVMKQQLFF